MSTDAREAYAFGWRTAANWMERDDLIADIGSPAYIKDRDAALAAQPAPEGVSPGVSLPPLPEPSFCVRIVADEIGVYTATQMQDYARAALAIQGAGNEFERGRQQGMQQERALWKLAASSQEIEGDPAGLPSAERCSGPDGESQR